MAAKRLDVLDGWRAASILLVLLGHLFPVGPKAWLLNGAVAGAGMAIFFTLSGFLITSVLLSDDDVRRFLIHRFMRIVPLAWLAMLLTLTFVGADPASFRPHLLFYANLLPHALRGGTGHFWSLCVEVQFYLGVALLVAAFGRRALFALPGLAIAVTLYRAGLHYELDIRTDRRIDEILAGCTLALAWNYRPRWFTVDGLPSLPVVLAPLLVASAHPAFPTLNYLRPWIASGMVASTLGATASHPMRRLLSRRPLRYIAEISFALYVIHGCLTVTWLDSGDKVAKYAKRPLYLAVTWALAHMSTRHFEAFFIRLGRRWSGRPSRQSGELFQ